MPNWCLNKLTVSHSDPAMIERFVNAYNAGMLCNEFVPEPDFSDFRDDSWYNWRINNWGTKWDVGAGRKEDEHYGLKATVVGDEVSCSFDSACSPPTALYDELTLQGFRVLASYFEPGMGFCGIYEDGVDDRIECHDKNMIPVQVWDDFGLDDFFTEDDE